MTPTKLIPLFVVSLLSLTFSAQAQDAPSQEDLEAQFTAMMANATLEGKNVPIVDGSLGQASGDSYKIVSATKMEGDQWQIIYLATVKGQQVPLPIPVTIQWAGDTAVLILDNMRGYSARVLFYDDTYAGTWSGNEKGGVISGIITRDQ